MDTDETARPVDAAARPQRPIMHTTAPALARGIRLRGETPPPVVFMPPVGTVKPRDGKDERRAA